jgi:hypothetical protein
MAETQDTQPLDSAEKAYAEAVTEAPVVLPALKPAKAATPKIAAPKAEVIAPKPVAPKAPVKKNAASSGKPTITALKEKIMAKTTAFADVQAKAKAAYEKGTAAAGEATEFTKGNVEALVESGKIFAEGAKAFGGELVAEGKTAFETLTADVKAVAAVKSPTDFFKFQSELMRRNFDAAVAVSSKNTEALVKLANDTFAPISTRVSLAVEKVSKAA